MSSIIMAADIRRSTFLMKEAVDEDMYAHILGTFIGSARRYIHESNGWFDKFTGDGFLAFWPYGFDASPAAGASGGLFFESAVNVLSVAKTMLQTFNYRVIPQLRSNSRNFPKSAGLSIGIDAGKVRLLEIAEDLTIVAPAVVGAVRMVSAARVGEVLLNVYLGEFLERNESEVESQGGLCISLDYRPTKEYDAQEVYMAQFASPNSQIRLRSSAPPESYEVPFRQEGGP
ncbi:hypothetical protein [Streptomyces bobili]|uniref:hypothetical protein n=1 Tax=Streptomyces bobili TaxID=67280 RepID=UPI0037BBE550